MIAGKPGRRLFLTALAALAILPLASVPASAQGVSAIRVDLAPHAAAAWGARGEAVRRIMTQELRAEFGPASRGGARLLVTVNSIFLSAYAGGGGGRMWDGGGDSDYLDSVAVLVGPRGEVLGRFPVLSAVPSTSGGAWYLPDNEPRRLEALARHNAGWIATQIARARR